MSDERPAPDPIPLPARVLIAGGSGLIGTPVVRALVSRGHDVTVLTRGERAIATGARPLRADRSDAASLTAALSGQRYDAVIDLLAYESIDVERLYAVPGLSFARYMVVSTGQVYLVAAERRPPFREVDAERPARPEPEPGTRDHANWVYGVGKRRVEGATREQAGARGVHATALRLPVVQGAGDPSRRLWAYLQRLLDRGPLLLPAGGLHPVRFVWSEDVARAVVTLVEGASAPAPAYNLAQPDEPTLAELVRAAASILGVEARIVPCSFEDLERAGLDAQLSPYSGPWCSRPDPTLASRDWGFAGTPSAGWLPDVVRAHLAEVRPEPHPEYAQRQAELALARQLERAGGAI